MSDRAVPCPWALSEGTIGDRIVFTHSPILHHKVEEENSQKELPGGASAPRPRISRASDYSKSDSSSGGNSSFAMVTVLSEPLEANISASLVFTPNGQATNPSRLEADRSVGDGRQDGSAQRNADEFQEQQQQQPKEGVAIILGPVVGRLEVVAQSGVVRESCCVPVVLEVDREGEVACVVSFEQISKSLV